MSTNLYTGADTQSPSRPASAASRENARTKRGQKRAEWLIPAGLIALSLVPVAAGAFRLTQLASGATITPENARFFAAPLPVVLHIVSVTVFALLGAFQFPPGFRRRRPRWHRIAGRLLAPAGLIAALSGLWMAHFYPWPEFDGTLLYVLRLIFGTAMAGSILLGVVAIRRRDFAAHRAWMIRGYAIGMGAGTQFFTHLPWMLFPDLQSETLRAALMAAGWVINLVVAEWIIRRKSSRPRARDFPQSSVSAKRAADMKPADL